MKLGRLGWTLLIGGGAALVGGVAYAMSGGSSTSGQPTYGSPTMIPAGPYKNLGTGVGVILLPNEVYLIAVYSPGGVVPSSWATNLATTASGFGATVLGVWVNKPAPAGWPAGAPAGAQAFIVLQTGAQTISADSQMTVWTTGGATS